MAQAPKELAVQFILKLVQLTQDRKMAWKVETMPQAQSKTAFSTQHQKWKLRIYKYSEEHPNPDYAAYVNSKNPFIANTTSSISSIFLATPEPPKTRLVQGTILQVLDNEDRVVYTVENRPALDDLYESASFSASGVGDLMASVLQIS